MKRNLLLSAMIAAGFGVSSVQAAVDVSDSEETGLSYASEIDVSTDGTKLTDNGANDMDIDSQAGIAINSSVTRFIRFDLDDADFNGALSLSVDSDTDSNATAQITAGGSGENFVVFQFSDDQNVEITSNFTLDVAGVDVSSKDPVEAQFRIFEFESDAVNADNPTFQPLSDVQGPYLDFDDAALSATANSVDSPVIDVTVGSTQFVDDPNANTNTNDAIIGNVQLDIDTDVLWTDSLAPEIADLVDTANSAFVISGSFSAVEQDQMTGDFNAGALISETGTNPLADESTEILVDEATFDLEGDVGGPENITLTVSGDKQIVAGDYTGVFELVPADGSTAGNLPEVTLSTLVLNGSEDTVPFAVVANQFFRVANPTDLAGPVEFSVFAQSGGQPCTFDLADLGLGSELAAGASTRLIQGGEIAGQCPNETTSGYRVVVRGNFGSTGAGTTTGEGSTTGIRIDAFNNADQGFVPNR